MIMTSMPRMTGTTGGDDNSLILGNAAELTFAGVVVMMGVVTVIRVHGDT
jgi:hypothetical protein